MKLTRGSIRLWPGGPLSPTWYLEGRSVAVTVADFGAHLCGVTLPNGGERVDVTCGYPAAGGEPQGYHGASVGRYANRIKGACFDLDGRSFALVPNEGEHQLHGGPDGFDKHVWVGGGGEVVGDKARVELHHQSPDGDQGFPGNVSATALFELEEDVLTIDYVAQSDAKTPINMTNHVYWNLGGPGSLDGHDLTVHADRYVTVDDAMIPLSGPPASVENTRFDCRSGLPLDQVVSAGGYDHCFVLDPVVDKTEFAATLRHSSGRRLDVRTNQVGLQVYTGRHLRSDRRGIALETQCLPDTPNRPGFGDATLRPQETYRSSTSFAFRW